MYTCVYVCARGGSCVHSPLMYDNYYTPKPYIHTCICTTKVLFFQQLTVVAWHYSPLLDSIVGGSARGGLGIVCRQEVKVLKCSRALPPPPPPRSSRRHHDITYMYYLFAADPHTAEVPVIIVPVGISSRLLSSSSSKKNTGP